MTAVLRLAAHVADRIADLLGAEQPPRATGGEPGSTWLAAVIRSDGAATPCVTAALTAFERRTA